MAKFDDFVSTVIDGSRDIAKDVLMDLQDQSSKDTKAFLQKIDKDLKRWTKLLADGRLTKEEFELLVRAKKDLLEMALLTEEGIVKTKLERVRVAVIDMVIDKAFDFFRIP